MAREITPAELNREKYKGILLGRVQKQEKYVQTLETSVLQLANYYFVFQGVIFTAIYGSPPSNFKCHFWYLPFFLSLSGAILNLVTLIIISVRHQAAIEVLEEGEEKWREVADLKISDYKGWIKCARMSSLICSLVVLASFAALNLYGAYKIPCYKNEQKNLPQQ